MERKRAKVRMREKTVDWARKASYGMQVDARKSRATSRRRVRLREGEVIRTSSNQEAQEAPAAKIATDQLAQDPAFWPRQCRGWYKRGSSWRDKPADSRGRTVASESRAQVCRRIRVSKQSSPVKLAADLPCTALTQDVVERRSVRPSAEIMQRLGMDVR